MKKKDSKVKYTLLCSLLSAATVLFLLPGCGVGHSRPVSRTDFYLDTVITVTLYDVTPNEGERLLDGSMALIDSYEKLFSKTIEGSDIWNINHSDGKPVTIHRETRDLLETALLYARRYDGMVDPSVGSLSDLWDFGSGSAHRVPSPDEIAEALSHVNYQNILLEDCQVTLKDKDTRIDLGFIAKGYIADRLKEYLVSKKVESAIINLGGNVVAIGQKPDGSPFQIGIQKPFAPEGTPALSLPISHLSLVSSGNYERYFETDGKLYHHILSTRDGYPIDNDLSQVTILSQSSADADALSTLCFILGYEKGSALIQSLPDVEAVFITRDGEILKTW